MTEINDYEKLFVVISGIATVQFERACGTFRKRSKKYYNTAFPGWGPDPGTLPLDPPLVVTTRCSIR